MKQAENIVNIVGTLSEVDIKTGVSKKTNKEYISGVIKIRTSETIDGTDYELEVPVRLFATKLTNKGQLNPAYRSIEDLQKLTSLQAAEDESLADKIEIENGEIISNDYCNRNGDLVTSAAIRTSFYKKVTGDYRPCATFNNVIVVGNIKDELDKEGIETGRLIISGIIPQYGDKVDVVPFIVEKKSSADFIRSHWKKGDTVRIAGVVKFSYKVDTQKVDDIGFGEPVYKQKTTSVREFIIKSGSQGCLDEKWCYSEEDIHTALKNRAAYHEEVRNNYQQRAAAAAAPTVSATDSDSFEDIGSMF